MQILNNTGARWIRNANEGENVWRQSAKGEASNNVHGGTPGEERFMEIDGMMRQTTKDTEEIMVQSKENGKQLLGDRDSTIMDEKTRSVKDGSEDTENGNIIIDPKRKRVDEGVLGEKSGLINMDNQVGKTQNGPKNVQMVGLGVGARQGL